MNAAPPIFQIPPSTDAAPLSLPANAPAAAPASIADAKSQSFAGLSRKPAAGRRTRVGRTRPTLLPHAAAHCRWSAILRRLRQLRPQRRGRRQPANPSTLNPVQPTVHPRRWLPWRNRRESLRRVAMSRRRRRPRHRDPTSIGLPMRRLTVRLPRQAQHQHQPMPRLSFPRRPRSRLRQSRPRQPQRSRYPQ